MKNSIINKSGGLYLMKLICDCFEFNDLIKYKKSGIDRIIVSLPFVSVRPVRVFSKDEMKELVNEAHRLGLEVGLNLLNFMLEEKIDLFEEALIFCKENDIDCIYFSDMGVFQLAKGFDLTCKCIYQPTTLITNSQDANAYVDLGLDRVVVSKEITYHDLMRILKKCKKCEVSVFGRNVMMHSRRKLLSSYFEFTHLEDKSDSQNLTLMEENRDERLPIYQDENGTHILSGSTFCLFEEMLDFDCDFRIDGYGLDEKNVLQAARDILRIMSKEVDPREVMEEYQKNDPALNISHGFMYKKTSLVKEGTHE